MGKYAYFPGCSPKSSAQEADSSARLLAQALGIELVELTSAACCGSRELRITNPRLSLTLNARTLASAEKLGLDIITICNTCQLNLQEDNLRLKSNAHLLKEVNETLEGVNLHYTGKVKVFHLLRAIYESWGPEVLRERVRVDLHGLKIAPFYGCHLLRPYEVLKFDDPLHPNSLRKIIQALGGEYVDYASCAKCCGFHILMTNDRLPSRLSGLVIKEAMESGAECMVTPCPLCHVALDAYQKQAEKEIGSKLGLPILHLQQLIGLAIGLDQTEMGLSKHMVSLKNLFPGLAL